MDEGWNRLIPRIIDCCSMYLAALADREWKRVWLVDLSHVLAYHLLRMYPDTEARPLGVGINSNLNGGLKIKPFVHSPALWTADEKKGGKTYNFETSDESVRSFFAWSNEGKLIVKIVVIHGLAWVSVVISPFYITSSSITKWISLHVKKKHPS